MASVTRAVIGGLRVFLDTGVLSLQSVYDDFPRPGQKLLFPSASIFTGKPIFVPFPHSTISTGAVDGVTGKTTFLKQVGVWNFDFQVDIWVDNKFDRHDIQEEFFNAFNSTQNTNGLNIQLSAYHNQWCHYFIDGFEYIDDEAGAQRGEWRLQFRVKADIPAVQTRMDHLITTVENNTGVPDSPTTDEDLEREEDEGGDHLETFV